MSPFFPGTYVAKLTLLQAHRYDTRTTIFSPEGNFIFPSFVFLCWDCPSKILCTHNPIGRLYQVEYALEAIGHAGTCLGVLSKDGVVLAAEKKTTSKLLDTSSSAEKIFKLDE